MKIDSATNTSYLISATIDTAHYSETTATMVELEQLKEQIDAAGEKIKTLKSSEGEVDKVAIAAAVNELISLKKQYADNNNGIGVDGKPFEAPMTKAEKKAKEKAEKAAGPAKQVRLFFVCCLSLAGCRSAISPSSWRIVLR
jgi:hypothetical protein